MKRYIFLTIILLSFSISFAQTQQGVVKTRGRVVNGQVVSGQRLSGATITLNFGNPLVSGQNGAFSFNVPTGKNYSLVAAKKQGYTLVDPEYTRRSFKYSASNPFFVVMEDEAQRQADINAATRKVRRTLTAQLQKREDEIEALKEQNKLTEAEYQKRLKELYDNQSKSEQLVKEMAERYVSTDYDQLDEFNRQVQMYIEEGELQKADSMIRSKGNMEQRVAEYHNIVAANKKAREELEQREAQLNESERGTAIVYENLSLDLLRKSEIFFQELKQDSALLCLKMRADIDTTNIEPVFLYAFTSHTHCDFYESEKYYLIGLRAYNNNSDYLNIAIMYLNLGNLYADMKDFCRSERCYKLSLDILNEITVPNSSVLETLADIYGNLAVLYNELLDFEKSEKYHLLTIENRELLYKNKPDSEIYLYNLSLEQANLAAFYFNSRNQNKCASYYKLSLQNTHSLFKKNPDTYSDFLATLLSNFGLFFQEVNNFVESEKSYKLALSLREHLFNQNPNVHRAKMARLYNYIAILYRHTKDFSLCEKYLTQALEQYKILSKKNPDAYNIELAGVLHSLGILYHTTKKFSLSEDNFKMALELKMHMLQLDHNKFRAELACTQMGLGVLYSDTKDYVNSERYSKLALANYEQLFTQYPDAFRLELADTQSNLGALYLNIYDYVNSKKYYELALENKKILLEQNYNAHYYGIANIQYILTHICAHNENYVEALERIDYAINLCSKEILFYNTKGEILLMQGKTEEALEMWKKVLELNPDFLKDYPDGTNLTNGLKKLGLIE